MEILKVICSFLGILYFPVVAVGTWTAFRDRRLKKQVKKLERELHKHLFLEELYAEPNYRTRVLGEWRK
jgi:uncharacterized membrane protein